MTRHESEGSGPPVDSCGAPVLRVVRDRAAPPPLPIWLRFVPPLVMILLALTLLVAGGNLPLFLAVRAALLPLGPSFWSAMTLLGDALVGPLLIIPFLHRRPRLLWAGTLAALLATAFTHLLKPLVQMPRPPAVLDLAVIGPRLLAGSFPSGHTATAFTVFALLLLAGVLTPRLTALGGVLAVLVGLSRMVVGVHWPADVLAGAAGGWICALAALGLAQRWPGGGAGWSRRVQIALLALIALFDLIGHDSGYPDGVLLQRVLAALALGWLARDALRRTGFTSSQPGG